MKNSITCPHCNSENAFYNVICIKCKYYLRDRIYNIDLWTAVSSLIDSPGKAFRNIIFSDHKNFIFFIFLFLSAKYLINTRFLSMLTVGEFQTTIELFFSYLILLSAVSVYFVIFTFIYKLFCNLNEIHVRIKDVFSIIIYSQIPFVLALIIVFPLELVIVGDYLFSVNPTPMTIKGSIAYLFLAVEIGVILWSMFLVFKGFKIQTHNFTFSISTTIGFIVLFWALLYFCSVIIFTL
jgi:hypothetical protein